MISIEEFRGLAEYYRIVYLQNDTVTLRSIDSTGILMYTCTNYMTEQKWEDMRNLYEQYKKLGLC